MIRPSRSRGSTSLRRNVRSASRVGTHAAGIEDAAFQDDDDDAIARVGGELEPFARRQVRPPLIVRRPRVGPDELERLDRLRLAVFEDLKFVARQPFDDTPLDGGIGVDADVSRAAAEYRRLLRTLLLPLWRDAPRRRHEDHKGHKGHEENKIVLFSL